MTRSKGGLCSAVYSYRLMMFEMDFVKDDMASKEVTVEMTWN